MVLSRAKTSTTEYSDVMTNHIPDLTDMTSNQCFDIKGDADVAGVFYLGGGTNGISIKVGSGAPSSVTSTQGSLYIDVAGSADSLLYINTNGSTTWSAVSNE